MANPFSTFVIVNHSAARARAAWGVVRRALDDAGVSFDAHEARAFGDARASARDALRAGYRTVAVVGGDGTLSEVVNGFFEPASGAARVEGVEEIARRGVGVAARCVDESDTDVRSPPSPINPEAALALLPAGTGNDFARAVEGHRASLESWIARLVAHCRAPRAAGAGETKKTTRAVDVLHGAAATAGGGAQSFLCLNAVTLGVGAEVAARVAAQGAMARRLSGEARFALAAAVGIARWRERRVRVRVDEGEERELRTNLIAVVNSRFAGGGMMFSPGALVDDGLLDVVTAARLSRATLVREMTRIHAGGHVANPRVRIERGARVRITPAAEGDSLPVEADGDVRGRTPLELAVMPRALRVVI
ncbi:MAG TPA: diacylglycerol kinase family protein [Pyrinomonadaceae bacterium]|nr:diacylglycerol kinase family protein [Pyrinomonadaceae bacterium]